MGREALLAVAADLLAETDLATAAGAVVGVRSVAARAGVSPSTVNHHFRPTGGGANTRLAAAAVQHALIRNARAAVASIADAAIEAVRDLSDGDPDALERVEATAAADVAWYDPGVEVARDALNAALFLALAAAPNSADARAALEAHYAVTAETYGAMFDVLLRTTHRRPLAGFDAASIAVVIAALADGFIQRRRFDPSSAPTSLYGTAAVRLFETLSTPVDAHEDRDPTDLLVPLPPGSHLDPHKRMAIARAASEVYRAQGWDGVTITAVQRAAGVSRRTVIVNFGDRDGLAAAVWAHFLPGLQAEINRSGEPVHRQVHRHLDHVSSIARDNRALTVSMLRGRLARDTVGAATTADPTDPWVMVPLEALLRPVLQQAATAFRPGQVDNPDGALDAASMLTTAALNLTLARPGLRPREVATRVCDTVLAGMLRRRPPTW